MSKRNTSLPVPHLASEKELNDFLHDSLGKTLKQAIQSTVSILIKAEMRQIREDLWKEHQEWPVFNGTYPRHLVSPAGKVENIPIPRFRSGGQQQELQTMKIFGEEKDRFHALVAQLHLAGVSQRKVNKFCQNIFGKAVAPSTTKIVFEELMEQESFQINKNSLQEEQYAFLFLDGIWETVKSRRTGETKKRVNLVVLGMDAEGKQKKILGFKLAFEEDEASWTALLASLQKRGFDLSKVQLAITDGGSGCLTALERLVPELKNQSCLTHRYRNIMKYTPHQLKTAMGKELSHLTQAVSREEFLQRATDVQKRWQTKAPRAVQSLIWKLKNSLTYFDFPNALWSRLRTTNPLERTFREVRVRTRIHFDHYQSPESSDKYHQAILGNINKTYFQNPSPSIYTQ